MKNRGWALVLIGAVMMLWGAGCSHDGPTAPVAGPQMNAAADDGDALLNKVMPVEGAREPVNAVLDGRYIIQLKQDKSPVAAVVKDLAARHGFTASTMYGAALRGFAARLTDEQAAALAAESQVLRIEPDRVMTVLAQGLPTGVDRMDAERNLFSGIDSGPDMVDVDIAIIDTGIDPDHPDLNVAGGVKLVGGTPDPNFFDGFGHGTHVAGIAAARNDGQGIVGVAPGARLWAVKVLTDGGTGSLSDIIAGLDWVAARADEIEVINMSLGGLGWSDAYRSAVQGCVNLGVVVVVAAGNFGMDVYGFDRSMGNWDDTVPAAFPEAMTISALADNDGLPGGLGGNTSAGPDDSRATFSNSSHNVAPGNPVNSLGAAIDLMLPGVDITSTVPGGGYEAMSGTSMASPHGAGLVALYIAEHGRAHDAAGVYAIRQALIDAGALQDDPFWGLVGGGDGDGNPEPIGMAASLTGFTDLGFRYFHAQPSILPGQTVDATIIMGNRGTTVVPAPVTVTMIETNTGHEVMTPRVVPFDLEVGRILTSYPHIRTPANLAPGMYTLRVQHDFSDDLGFNDAMSIDVEVLPVSVERQAALD